MQEYKLYIAGEFCDSKSGKALDSTNPATEAPWARVARADREDTRRAIQAARKAAELARQQAEAERQREEAAAAAQQQESTQPPADSGTSDSSSSSDSSYATKAEKTLAYVHRLWGHEVVIDTMIDGKRTHLTFSERGFAAKPVK